MNELKREEIIRAIWRLCEQMAYAAEHGHVQMLKAQTDALKKMIARLDMIDEMVKEVG